MRIVFSLSLENALYSDPYHGRSYYFLNRKMDKSENSRFQMRCAEDVALLSYLGRNYDQPRRYSADDPRPDSRSGRTLSFSDERRLTSALAFISSIREDPNRITAVCVEESSSGLTIMLAVNAKSWCLSPYLQSVKAGFDRIFNILQEASSTSRESLNDGVFSAIVSTCRLKIFRHARLIKSKTRKELKAPIENMLETLVKGLSRLPKDESITTLSTLSKNATLRLSQYRANPIKLEIPPSTKDIKLEAIIEDFYQIYMVSNLKTILSRAFGCLSRKMDPETLPTLLDIVRKIASYKKSALTLVNISRSSSKVRRASTVIVSLKPASFSRYERTKPIALAMVLQRIADTHKTGWETDPLAITLSTKLEKKQKGFVGILKELEKNAKVHAEVQLVWYLRGRQSPNPPRFIASSKKACYLCNALISKHSNYAMLGTHGRLYEGWWLPSGGITSLDEQFIVDLERTAIDQIEQICNGKATKMKDPRESTAPSTMSQRSTILTLGEEEPEADHVSDSDDTVVPEKRRSRSSSSTTARQNTSPTALPEPERQAPSPPPPPPPPDKVVRFDSNPVMRSAVSVVTPVWEKKEEPVPCDENKQWRSVESGGTDVLRFHGFLNLHIEYTTERPADGLKPLRFSVRRMSEEESLGSAGKKCPVYDADSLEEIICDAGCEELILRRRGEMFKVDLEAFETTRSN